MRINISNYFAYLSIVWVLDPLKLELKAIMNYHLSAENETLLVCKSSNSSLPLSHCSSPFLRLGFTMLHSLTWNL